MGRPTSDCIDALLAAKIKLLVSHALDRAAKDLPNGKRSFQRFVEDLDVHDSFSKRIFELLVKETIQRRPRPAKIRAVDEARDAHGAAPSVYRVPSRQEGREEARAAPRARRYEARLAPYLPDLAGSPAHPSEAVIVSRRGSPSLERQRSTEDGAFYAVGGRFGPPGRVPEVNLERHLERSIPDWLDRAGEISEATAEPSAPVMPMSPPRELFNLLSPSPVDDHLISLVGPGSVLRPPSSLLDGRTSQSPQPLAPPLIRPQARADFEAFSSRQRSRRRQADYDILEHSDEVYERLGSSSSVAALAGLEYAHASWDRDAVRERDSETGLMSATEFLWHTRGNHHERAEVVRETDPQRFEDSDARAPV